MDLNSLVSEFSSLKISALSKSMIINQYVDEVTIGPNSKLSPSQAVMTNTRIKKTDPVDSPKSKPITNKESPKQHVKVLQSTHTIHHTVLSNLEKTRRENEIASIEVHTKTIDMFHKQLEARKVQQWKHQQALKLQEIQYQEMLIMQAMKEVEVESRQECQKASAKNKQRQQANDDLLKAKAEEQLRLQKLTTHFSRVEQEIIAVIKDIEGLFKNNQEAKSELTQHEIDWKNLLENFKNRPKKIRTINVVEQDIALANEMLNQSKQMKGIIKTTIKQHYEERERAAAESVALLRKKELEHAQNLEEAILPVQAEQAQATEVPNESTITTAEAVVAPEENTLLKTYVELQAFLANHQQSYKELLDDQSYKQFKFDCKKAVNIPVNAISAVSSEHLRDKYSKLHNLLAGKSVQISDSRINASQHPQGIAFVTDLLAKKFVLQGDLTISSNPDAAFAYATIIITLWNDFPIFGKLLLAYFYKQCPYLVPIYFQKQEGQSDEEFYTLMGYQYNEQEIEKQDKFLKRMTGISKLYFSILISHPKRATAANPHNITNGWMWFARTLNMPPYVDVTATLMYSFLEVAGCAMQTTYGKQFKKLILYITKYQIPLLKEKDSGGPLFRLEVMLQEYYKTGVTQGPQGVLSKHFW